VVSTDVNGTSSTFVEKCSTLVGKCSKTGRSRCDELGEQSTQLKGRCQADPSKISLPQSAETEKVDKCQDLDTR
jgi:hypothetical protein